MWRTAKGKGKRELLRTWGTRLDNLPLTLCHSAPALLHSPTVMLVPTTLAPRQAGTLVTIQYRGNSSFKCRIRFRSCLVRTVYITTSNWIHVFIFHARGEDHRLFMHGRFIDQQNSYLLSFVWGGIPLQKTWFSTISVFQGTQSLAPALFHPPVRRSQLRPQTYRAYTCLGWPCSSLGGELFIWQRHFPIFPISF